MGRAYVSEFAGFMNHFLEDHPEVIEEQRRGWEFFWDAKVDPTAADITNDDLVPDDNYGFSWPVVHAESPGVKNPAGSE